ENYFLDDGAYLMVRLLIELANARKEGRTLESLIADLKEPKEAKEFRFKILAEDFKTEGQKVLDDLEKAAETKENWFLVPNNYEGVRVNVGQGWFLLRLSLHDPILPLNVESDEEGGLRPIVEELYDFLKEYEALDLAPIRAFLS
ncbi:MAG: phosphomannomutase/phosphoglucomutase, partial [Lachnospiraceae bacterium]|nr:phosphomannomutase/phosphoglucomutase [Lachnospiraceae bacterium]